MALTVFLEAQQNRLRYLNIFAELFIKIKPKY